MQAQESGGVHPDYETFLKLTHTNKKNMQDWLSWDCAMPREGGEEEGRTAHTAFSDSRWFDVFEWVALGWDQPNSLRGMFISYDT